MVIVECNRGLWELTEENYHEMIRQLAHGEVVHLPKLGTRLGEVSLSIGSITRDAARRLYQEREVEKMASLIKEIRDEVPINGHRDDGA